MVTHKFYSYFTYEICGIRVFAVISSSYTYSMVTKSFEIASGVSYLFPSDFIHSGIHFSRFSTTFSKNKFFPDFGAASSWPEKLFTRSSYRPESSSNGFFGQNRCVLHRQRDHNDLLFKSYKDLNCVNFPQFDVFS